MTIVEFPRPYRPRVEVFTVIDLADGRKYCVFEYVGHDEDGAFRVDVAHASTLEEVVSFASEWERDGVRIVDTGVLF